jgi:hypothetical protein
MDVPLRRLMRVGAAGEEQRGHVDVEGVAALYAGGVFAADSVPEQGQSVLGLVFDVVACVQDLPELEQVVLFDCLVAWWPGGLGCGPARGRVRWRRR